MPSNPNRRPWPKMYSDVNRDQFGQPVSFASPFTDSFGFLRTSSPLTLFDSKLLEDKQTLFWDEQLNGTAASAHTASLAMVQMSVAADGDYAIRQTYQRIPYQPGRSQLALFTGKMAIEENIEKRIGLMLGDKNSPYSVTDGVYWMMSGSQMCCVVSRAGEHNITPQSEWNFDPLDGEGVSKISGSWDRNQIFGISYAWLGVGRVSFFLNVNGLNVPVHTVDHANVSDQVGAYLSSPSMPVRYEIRSAGSTGSLDHICTQVASEGGLSSKGSTYSVSTGTVNIAGNTANTYYAVCGVRLTSSYAAIELLDASCLDESKNDLDVVLAIDPVLTGSVSWVGISESGVEVMSGSAQSITCHPSAFNYVAEQTHGSAKIAELLPANAVSPGMAIDGTPQQIVLLCSPLGAGSIIQGSISFKVYK